MSTSRDETELRVLLVDADEDDFVLTRDIFSEFPDCRFRLDWITDFDEAVDTICRKAHDLYLIDDRLSKSNGLELIRIADAQQCTAPMLLLTGRGDRGPDVTSGRELGVEFLDSGTLDASLLGRGVRFTHQQKRHSELLERKVDERTAQIALTNRILHDEIAERKRAEAALREADRRKDEFLVTLAHELRNPLAPICNALEILRIAGHRPEILEAHRAMIDRQVRQMIRIIDDLLDISRISRGKILLRTERVELGTVISNAVESIRPMIDRAGHSLSVNLPDTPIELDADPTRLAQVLLNLLSNAARYTESGGRISLDVVQEASAVRIHIKDNGIGIPAEQLPHIFETFAQIHPSSEQSRSGLGIGLSLVRSLVHLHDGSIEVLSEGEGCGSEFIVRIPIDQPKAHLTPE